ncbi:dihydrofolate reductase [Actinomyces weissii]|uniref:dihydrofolate reductase n=1 Tax=Actinomyces weissii TaxID=675090 RepID=A0A7T7MBA2_9ACTO|nr:dihydrofolate reductase [Actinomyces weissii]
MTAGPGRRAAGAPEGRSEQAAVGAIWAQDRGGLLGADGGMLWRVPADFRHFKAATLGGAVIMGRTTWDSLGGRPLPGRLNIVLSRRPGWQPRVNGKEDQASAGAPTRAATTSPADKPAGVSAAVATSVQVARDLPGAVLTAVRGVVGRGLADPREGTYRQLPRVWVIGGGSIYRQALEAGLVGELLVSRLDLDVSRRAEALEEHQVVRAPLVDLTQWLPGPMMDPADQWRPVSGDAAWRVDHWQHPFSRETGTYGSRDR